MPSGNSLAEILQKVRGMKRIDLKNWQLNAETNGKIGVKVPGDVSWDLYKAGIIDDPLFGDNLKKIEYVFHKDWLYEVEFTLTETDFQNEKILLCFEGIDTLSEIKLNGNVIGRTDNMFLKYEYNLKDDAVIGKNSLSVKIFSATDYCKKVDEHLPLRAIFDTGRLYLRKAQCHFGWDWAPDLPGAGIYLPAYIELSDGRITDVYIKTKNTGEVSVSIQSDILSEGAEVVAKIADNELIGRLINGKAELKTTVNNPDLWNPVGYGEPNLYSYNIELKYQGKTLDEKKGKFGFKEIELIEEPIEGDKFSFYFKFNGKKIFAKGSNWVPISNMSGAIEDESYVKLLNFAKESNMNILRVWGGGLYEKEIFYRLCDELGILVWQDFGFSCSVIPAEIDGIEENFLKEADYQIRRLRNHASLGILCGGNENYVNFDKDIHKKGAELVQVKLKNLVEELSVIPYIYNSPSSCLGEDEYGCKSGDGHLSALDATIKKVAFDDFRAVIAEREYQFVSESALLGPSRKRSLKKFLPEKSLEKIDDIWDFHFVKNPYSKDCSDSFINKEMQYADKFFGKTEDINDFLKKGMIAHLETLGAELDFARANPNCGGYMNWMYNDNWGCGTWSLVDYYFEKKPVYYRVKRSFTQIYVAATVKKDGTYAFIANDSEKIINGVLTFEAKTLNGDVLKSKSLVMDAEPHSVKCVPIDFAKEGDYIAVTYNSEKSYKSLFFRKQWKNLKFISALSSKVESVAENKLFVTLKANAFAKNVFIDYPDNDGLIYSDNYFDMENGETKIIEITADKSINKQFVSIKTFADAWID